MASIVRLLSRPALLRQASCMLTRRSNLATKTAYEEMGNFWAKNRNLNRPLSPHLTVYKMHMSMTLSITNRVLAVAIQAGFMAVPVILLCLPGDFRANLEKFHNLSYGPLMITTAKLVIAAVFSYHTLAGIRHLAWDAGFGYSTPMVAKTGFVLLATTFMMTLILAFGIKPSYV